MNLRKVLNPNLVLCHLCRYIPFRFISDELYLRIFYEAYQGRKLDLKNPKTFNEKLQWLKLYDRNPLYTDLSDKYKVREFVKKKIGEEYLIPLLGKYSSAEEIDFTKLPNEFVLKCNHDSGSVVICKDKSNIDENTIRKSLNKALKKQYFWKSREYNYRNIERCIIAEQLLKNDGESDVPDYKYFCFWGKPQFIQVDTGRFSNHIRNFYNTNWEYIDVEYGIRNDPSQIMKQPEQHQKMLELAAKLSDGFPHVRVDFYVVSGKVYFGEMTFHHGGGAMKVNPIKYDYEWGKLLDLPKK